RADGGRRRDRGWIAVRSARRGNVLRDRDRADPRRRRRRAYARAWSRAARGRGSGMSWQLGAFAILAFALASGFAWYERTSPDARIIALVGTLAALAALGRIAFAPIPNVKPTTDI